MNPARNLQLTSVVRGFIPVRLRSSRKPETLGMSGEIRLQDLGLLRNPTGINPLATVELGEFRR